MDQESEQLRFSSRTDYEQALTELLKEKSSAKRDGEYERLMEEYLKLLENV